MSDEQDIELWKRELVEGGWEQVREDVWKSQSGLLYRGPFQAWKLMKSHPELSVIKSYY